MSLLNIKIGDKAPEIFNAIVEIPKDSQNKYEIDKKTGMVSPRSGFILPDALSGRLWIYPRNKSRGRRPGRCDDFRKRPAFPGMRRQSKAYRLAQYDR